ncbi:hypothetical protein E2320_003729 [Naja naja]|nr:hypothetical protein E2320_003729 [Naja naja]
MGVFSLAKDGCETRAKWFQPRHRHHSNNHCLPDNRHGDEFHDDREIVSILSDNLEEEASDWCTQVHDEGAPELDNSSSQAQEAEAEIKMIKQKGWPAKEIVKEFRCLAGRLSNWPKRILVHYFKECLDEELLKICICRAMRD